VLAIDLALIPRDFGHKSQDKFLCEFLKCTVEWETLSDTCRTERMAQQSRQCGTIFEADLRFLLLHVNRIDLTI
jgi:hypothetical protein